MRPAGWPGSRPPGRRCGGHAQTPQIVLRGERVPDSLLNVLDRYQALEPVVVIDHQQLLDAVSLKDCFGFVEGSAHGHGDQVVFRHRLADRQIEPRLEPQIAIGENPHQMSVFLDDRDTRDPITFHHFDGFRDWMIGGHRNRIDYHSGLAAFYFVDFVALVIDGKILMNHSNAALLRDSDRQMRFSHSIHRRGRDRNIERDVARKASSCVGFCRKDAAASGNKRNVVKGESFRNVAGQHRDTSLMRVF